jgi:hypothetical protein
MICWLGALRLLVAQRRADRAERLRVIDFVPLSQPEQLCLTKPAVLIQVEHGAILWLKRMLGWRRH